MDTCYHCFGKLSSRILRGLAMSSPYDPTEERELIAGVHGLNYALLMTAL